MCPLFLCSDPLSEPEVVVADATVEHSANMDAPNFTIDSQSLHRINDLSVNLNEPGVLCYFFPPLKNLCWVKLFVNDRQFCIFPGAGDPV